MPSITALPFEWINVAGIFAVPFISSIVRLFRDRKPPSASINIHNEGSGNVTVIHR